MAGVRIYGIARTRAFRPLWMAKELGIELVELDQATCTGAGVIQEQNPEMADALNARTFALAQQLGLPLMNICSTCQGIESMVQDKLTKRPEYLAKVNAILDKYKKDLIYTIAGHPGNGNFHIIPLMDLKNPRVRALIPKISEEVYRVVLQYHGSITAEHNDGLIRTPYLEEMYGPKITALFREVKNIFDPLNIFNPGKKVGGDLKYSEEHIATTQ